MYSLQISSQPSVSSPVPLHNRPSASSHSQYAQLQPYSSHHLGVERQSLLAKPRCPNHLLRCRKVHNHKTASNQILAIRKRGQDYSTSTDTAMALDEFIAFTFSSGSGPQIRLLAPGNVADSEGTSRSTRHKDVKPMIGVGVRKGV